MLKFYELPYDATALEPVISADTMQTHHNKHYKGYYDKMLEEMARLGIQAESIEQMMEGDKWSASEKSLRTLGLFEPLKFWFMLRPIESPRVFKATSELIERDFGSFDAGKKVHKAAKAVGWLSVGFESCTGKTSIFSTPTEFPEMSKMVDNFCWIGRMGACLLPRLQTSEVITSKMC